MSRERFKNIILVSSIVLLLTMVLFAPTTAQGHGPGLFEEIRQLIEERYVEEVDEEYLYQGAIDGMLWQLDPYSSYYTPEEYQEFAHYLDSVYSGVGLYLVEENDRIMVADSVPGSPASQAGIQVGDYIEAVDGEDVTGHYLEEVVDLIKGEEGSQVMLEIYRENVGALKFVLVREKVDLPSVEIQSLEGDIGYIKLENFSDGAVEEMRSSLDYFDRQEASGLILDLRGNMGGYVWPAVDIASYFVSSPVAHLAGRDEVKEPVEVPDNIKWNRPLVVLVDYHTASAAELLAGAIQDYGKGVLVGSHTYGKGTVQNILELEKGGYLVLSTKRFYTPEERDINWTGLEPDYPVEEEDKQLPKARAALWQDLYPEGKAFVLDSKQTYFSGSAEEVLAAPFKKNQQVYLPLRPLLEMFEIEPEWNPEKREVSFTCEDREFTLGIGEILFKIGLRSYHLNAPPVIENDSTMVPLDFLDYWDKDYSFSRDEKAVIVENK